jgi:aminoglycoside phosphotransferase (APT) family kinase protein
VAETVAVRPSDELDWPALEHHLRRVLDVADDPMTVRQFGEGRANLTYLVTFGDRQFVVRRPPRGTLAPGAHDMHREFRVLSRLNDHYPRAPRALHYSDDVSIVGAPFLVVEHREGVVIHGSIPDEMMQHADVVRRVDLALLDAAADLHTVDVDAVGLGRLGKAGGFGRRQVDGWRERWQRAAPREGSAAMDEAAERLAATVPEPTHVAIVHNDLKLDNCQFSPRDPDTVTSVFDWDMATLGDPLFDLGLLLVSMGTSPLWTLDDADAVAHYSARSGIDVERISWYLAFATWRTAVVLQQLFNRYLAGDSADERHASFGASISLYADRARALVLEDASIIGHSP